MRKSVQRFHLVSVGSLRMNSRFCADHLAKVWGLLMNAGWVVVVLVGGSPVDYYMQLLL